LPASDSPEAAQRAAVVAEARKWILTPYHSNGDIRGVGVDCGMILVRVFVDLGLVAPFDPRPYPTDWHLHRSAERYLGFVGAECSRVTDPQPGDVVVFRYGRCYSHGGIVTRSNPLTIIHAHMEAGMVVEDIVPENPRLSDPERKPLFFSFWAQDESKAEKAAG